MPEKKAGASPKKGRSSSPLMPPAMIDPRAMEKQLADVTKLLSSQDFNTVDEANTFLQQALAGGQVPSVPPATPLEQAQELMYQAWGTTGRRRVKLAREALSLSPDCADAYVLLAEETSKTPEDALELYLQGVEAGLRALGANTFHNGVGRFWNLIETRPYMRAREGLAHVLWIVGEPNQAIEHLKAMLLLNPNDNQGVRHVLASYLAELDANEELGTLLEQYRDDPSATWTYTRALWLFRTKGPNRTATAALKQALRANPFVPAYLTGEKKLPQQMPDFYGIGDENEAMDYVFGAAPAWVKTPGALEWLATTLRS
ncbi:MAG: hypothetical protein H0X37_23920 [Herpetosiphonaceae bacterium]|nr:hypothetical protein [Herpetosiphonaceae bacterium]